MDHFLCPPDSTFDGLSNQIRYQVELDIFSQGHFGYFNTFVKHRNSSISIDDARIPQAENIFERGIWFGEYKGAKQAITKLFGLCKTNGGNFTRSRMNLVVIITFDFVLQDAADILQAG
jgi:hypothetical protein